MGAASGDHIHVRALFLRPRRHEERLYAQPRELRSGTRRAGILFIIPQGGGVPSQALKDAVKRQVTVVYPCTLTFQVAVQDPVYLAVEVTATVHLRQGANAKVVRTAIGKALADFFAMSLPNGTPNPTVDFGWNIKDANGEPAGEVAFSDVFDVVRDVAGVRKVGDGPGDFLLNGAREDLELGTREFPTRLPRALVRSSTPRPGWDVSQPAAPRSMDQRAAVHEQFEVTRGTMRTLTVLRQASTKY